MVSPAGQPAVFGTKLAGTDQALSAVTLGEDTRSRRAAKILDSAETRSFLLGPTAVCPAFVFLPPERSTQLPGQDGIPQPSSWLGPCDLRSRAVRNKLASVLHGKESGKHRELWEC